MATHNEALYDIPQARTQQRTWPSGRMLSERQATELQEVEAVTQFIAPFFLCVFFFSSQL